MPISISPNQLFAKKADGTGYLPANVISGETTEAQCARVTAQGTTEVQRVQTKAQEVTSQLANAAEVRDMVAGTFSSSTNYTAGQIVIVTNMTTSVNELWRFTADHPAGDWIGTDAVKIKLANDVSDLKSALANEEYNTRNNQLTAFIWKQGAWVNGAPDNRANVICIDHLLKFSETTKLELHVPTGYQGLVMGYTDSAGMNRTVVDVATDWYQFGTTLYYNLALQKTNSGSIVPSEGLPGIFILPLDAPFFSKMENDITSAYKNVNKNYNNDISGLVTSFPWIQGVIINGKSDGRLTAISINSVFALTKQETVYVNAPTGYKCYYNTYSYADGNTRTAVTEITSPSIGLAAGYYSFFLTASNGTDSVSVSVGAPGIISFKYGAENNALNKISLLSENVFRNNDLLFIPIWDQGVIKSDQTTDTRTTAIHSQIFTVGKNTNIKCVFGSSYKVILAVWNASNTNTEHLYITSNTAYTILSGYKFAFAIEKNPSANITPNDGENIAAFVVSSGNSTQFLSGLKIGILGDSITARSDASYWESGIEAITGAEVTRYGVGGTMIQGSAENQSFISRYTNIAQDTDIIIVEGGTNDWGNNGTLGELNYQENQWTLYGALMILFKGLQNSYPNAKVYVCTPPQRDFSGTGTTAGMGYNTAATPWTFEQCQEAIKTMARYWGFEIIDLFAELGWSANNVDEFTSDGLHPNQSGYNRMTSVVCAHINHPMYEFSN